MQESGLARTRRIALTPSVHPSDAEVRDGTSIRVILVDDHELVRCGLAALLAPVPDIRVVAQAEDGAALLALLEHTTADVVVCDIAMPGMDGLEAIQHVHSLWPDVRILVLSMEDSPQVARRALAQGAAGYLVKRAGTGELRDAIRAVMAGHRYLSPIITQSVLGAAPDSPQEQLTSRQVEILALLAQGCSSRVIASRLGLSPKTVDVHRARIMDRLHIRDVAGLTRYAIRHRLIN